MRSLFIASSSLSLLWVSKDNVPAQGRVPPRVFAWQKFNTGMAKPRTAGGARLRLQSQLLNLLLGAGRGLGRIRRTIQVLRLCVFLAGRQARVFAIQRATCGRIDAEGGVSGNQWLLHAAARWR